MADLNYVSPGSLMPNIQQAPSGLAGMMMGEQMNNYRNAVGLQQLMSMMGAVKQVNSMEEYAKDAPLRQAKRDYDTFELGEKRKQLPLTNALDIDTRKADLKGKNLKNTFDESTLGSRILTTNLEGDAKQVAANERSTNDLIEALQFLKRDIGSAPDVLAMSMLQSEMERLGIKPNSSLGAFLLQGKNGKDIASRIEYAREQAINNIDTGRKEKILGITEQGKMSRELVKGNVVIDVASIRADALRDVAQYAAQQKAATTSTKESIEQFMTRRAREMASQGVSQEAIDLWLTQVKMYGEALKQAEIRRRDNIFGAGEGGIKKPVAPPVPTPPTAPNAPQMAPPNPGNPNIPRPPIAPPAGGGAPAPGSNILRFDNQGNPIK